MGLLVQCYARVRYGGGLGKVSVLVCVQAVGFCARSVVSQTFSCAVASYGTQDLHCCR